MNCGICVNGLFQTIKQESNREVPTPPVSFPLSCPVSLLLTPDQWSLRSTVMNLLRKDGVKLKGAVPIPPSRICYTTLNTRFPRPTDVSECSLMNEPRSRPLNWISGLLSFASLHQGTRAVFFFIFYFLQTEFVCFKSLKCQDESAPRKLHRLPGAG